MVARSDDVAMTIVSETPVRRWPCNVPDNIYTFKFPNLARLLHMGRHGEDERRPNLCDKVKLHAGEHRDDAHIMMATPQNGSVASMCRQKTDIEFRTLECVSSRPICSPDFCSASQEHPKTSFKSIKVFDGCSTREESRGRGYRLGSSRASLTTQHT